MSSIFMYIHSIMCEKCLVSMATIPTRKLKLCTTNCWSIQCVIFALQAFWIMCLSVLQYTALVCKQYSGGYYCAQFKNILMVCFFHSKRCYWFMSRCYELCPALYFIYLRLSHSSTFSTVRIYTAHPQRYLFLKSNKKIRHPTQNIQTDLPVKKNLLCLLTLSLASHIL